MPFPRERGWDSTLSLLHEGYLFGMNRFRRLGTDAFRTRLMLSPVTYAYGEDAARMFYHPDRLTRIGAMPPATLLLLQDRGSVSLLDAAHRRRKAMFLSLLTPEAVRRLGEVVADHWRARLTQWATEGRVTLHTSVEGILCRAVCEWAGAPR